MHLQQDSTFVVSRWQAPHGFICIGKFILVDQDSPLWNKYWKLGSRNKTYISCVYVHGCYCSRFDLFYNSNASCGFQLYN